MDSATAQQGQADLIANEKIELAMILGFLAAGAFLVWVGIKALDPAWVAGTRGRGWMKLVLEAIAWIGGHTSPGLRATIFIGLGAVCLAIALLGVLNNIYWREPQLIVDAAGIESRSDKGKGRVAWPDIASVRVIDGVLRVSGTVGTDISVAIGDIDKDERQIFAAIARHRPGLLPASTGAVAT